METPAKDALASETSPPLVIRTVQAGVAQLTLNRPDKRNALNGPMMQALASGLDAVRDDPEVRVVVLCGAGPAFSSGIDHTLLLEVFQKSQQVPFRHVHHDLQDVFHRIERMEKPVIAVLHRACAGMALELALACDFRIALADCVMGLPEVAFGIIPDVGGTTRLVRTVGVPRAKELILTGKFLTAETAGRWGLVHEVATDAADLEARVTRLCARLAGFSPITVGMGKSLIQQSADASASSSFQLEGVVQQALIAQPDLMSRFSLAVQFIREQMANPE